MEEFRRNLEGFLEQLTSRHKYLYVNLLELFWTSGLLKVESTRARCMEFETVTKECTCLHLGDALHPFAHQDKALENAEKLDTVSDRMNGVLYELANKYDFAAGGARPDVAVNVVRAWEHWPAADLSYLSELDCFHPSLKTHNIMAQVVWNSMLGAQRGPVDVGNATVQAPACAEAGRALASWGTKERAVLV